MNANRRERIPRTKKRGGKYGWVIWVPPCSYRGRPRRQTEGVAIPRCALMASSSLEVLENSSVITFSSDRRQRGSMGTDRPETPAIFYTLLNALLTLHWQSEKIVLRANRLSNVLRRSNRSLSLSHFACWYKLKSRSDISCKKSVIIGDFILFYFSKLYYNIVYFCYLKI